VGRWLGCKTGDLFSWRKVNLLRNQLLQMKPDILTLRLFGSLNVLPWMHGHAPFASFSRPQLVVCITMPAALFNLIKPDTKPTEYSCQFGMFAQLCRAKFLHKKGISKCEKHTTTGPHTQMANKSIALHCIKF